MIMQDFKRYPAWAQGARKFWIDGWNGKFRIASFWAGWGTASLVVITIILTGALNWDDLTGNWDLRTTELGRAMIAGFIGALDMTILMQDWDFPNFEQGQDIKMPGLNLENIDFTFFGMCGEFFQKDYFRIIVTGKWFNYGIM